MAKHPKFIKVDDVEFMSWWCDEEKEYAAQSYQGKRLRFLICGQCADGTFSIYYKVTWGTEIVWQGDDFDKAADEFNKVTPDY
jgi:hypothetical protein